MSIEVVNVSTSNSKKTDKVALLFFKNRIGEYIYSSPVCVELEHNDYYKVCRGVRKGQWFSLNSCVSSSGMLSKLSSKGGNVSLKAISKFDFKDLLAIVLDDEIEKHVYNLLREKKKEEPDENVFIYALLGYGDKIGKSINKIEKKALGGLSAEINSDFDDSFDNLNADTIAAAFNNPKPKVATAEAGVGKKTQIKTQNSNQHVTKQGDSSSIKKSTSDVGFNEKSTGKDTSLNSSNENIDSSSTGKIDVIEIKKKIRKKVIGQDRAIDDVVNNIFFNQRYIDTGDRDLLRNKANIILDGSTGTGKTFILDEVASEMKLPIHVTGVTNYSTVGYSGDSLTSILYKLLEKADGNLELAERGIVVFDEFDKLGGFSNNDISMRRALQQELLTFISGTNLNVEYNGQTYSFDTSKLTFIAMGAFTDLRERKIKENEKKYKSSIGFSSNNEDEIKRMYTITKDDYVAEGLERELVGRFFMFNIYKRFKY